MATPEREIVRTIAAAIADGEPVDWDGLIASDALSADELRALRLLETLREFHSVKESGVNTASDPGILPLETGFEVLEEIARGAGGRVYRALDRALGREVALKVLDPVLSASPKSQQRFVQEARVLASLSHPNIVRIHSVDEHDGRIRLSLELISGTTLEQLVKNGGRLAPEEAGRIGADLCRALAALHARSLVHRDLKPSNVMREGGGRIVLLDFGVVRSSVADGEGQAAAFAGTPLFMAPEQFEGRSEVGPATDVFGLGALLYWLVSERCPFGAATYDAVRERTLTGLATPLADVRPDVSPAFAAIVERAIARRPEERFPSAGAFERELRRFLGVPGGGTSADSAAHGPTSLPRRFAIPALGLGALILLAIYALTRSGTEATRSGGADEEFEFRAELYAVRNNTDVRLRSGDPIRASDGLVLETFGSRDLYVYVFDQDDKGVMTVLFPVPGFRPTNPLAAGIEHRLPGVHDSAEQEWLVAADESSEENILVLASATPMAKAEDWLRKVPPVKPGEAPAYAPLNPETRAAILRGITQTRPKPQLSPSVAVPAGERSIHLRDLIDSLEDRPVRSQGFYARLIALRRQP